MGATGLLTERDRIELLEGWIVPKMIQNLDHALAIENGQAALQAVIPTGWRLRVQLPITTLDSEPEPDFAIVRHRRKGRSHTHPLPADVALVIEVADSSLSIDRRVKGRLYARASIPFYWIVNLIDRRVEVYSDATGQGAEPAYQSRRLYGIRRSVPLMIAGRQVASLPVRHLLS